MLLKYQKIQELQGRSNILALLSLKTSRSFWRIKGSKENLTIKY